MLDYKNNYSEYYLLYGDVLDKEDNKLRELSHVPIYTNNGRRLKTDRENHYSWYSFICRMLLKIIIGKEDYEKFKQSNDSKYR